MSPGLACALQMPNGIRMILFHDQTAVLGDTESSMAGAMIRETGTTHWIENEGAS